MSSDIAFSIRMTTGTDGTLVCEELRYRRTGPFPFLCDDGRIVNLYGPLGWYADGEEFRNA